MEISGFNNIYYCNSYYSKEQSKMITHQPEKIALISWHGSQANCMRATGQIIIADYYQLWGGDNIENVKNEISKYFGNENEWIGGIK